MNKETIAGDIRRIRAILKPDCDGYVRANYYDLLKLFDVIEKKAQEKEEEISDYKKRVAVYEDVVAENGGRFIKQESEITNRNALIIKLTGVLASYMNDECNACRNYCRVGDEQCEHQKRIRALITKSLELMK